MKQKLRHDRQSIHRDKITCDSPTKYSPCNHQKDEWYVPADVSLRRKADEGRLCKITEDSIQDLEISVLKEEVMRLNHVVSMLLVLVDPEDVAAALRIKELMPTDEELQDLADDFVPPLNLFNNE